MSAPTLLQSCLHALCCCYNSTTDGAAGMSDDDEITVKTTIMCCVSTDTVTVTDDSTGMKKRSPTECDSDQQSETATQEVYKDPDDNAAIIITPYCNHGC